jgi:hypothetical protein
MFARSAGFAALAVLALTIGASAQTISPRPEPTPNAGSSDRSSPSPRTTPEPNQTAPDAANRSGGRANPPPADRPHGPASPSNPAEGRPNASKP